MTTSQLRVQRAIEALQGGKGIVLCDDDDRENEGDLIFAASMISVPNMAFMIRHCSGIVCLCLTPERAAALALEPMVSENTSRFRTAFTVSIEARDGVTTGVSAADRLQTIRVAIDPASSPSDLARPGHVFPIVAHADGVKGRRGHTEGSIDLMRRAALPPSAVLCELMNDDGTMMRGATLERFATLHAFPVVTIDDLATTC
jgi:3,4-dihydroxy 2-butanone 4-phosphate synthase